MRGSPARGSRGRSLAAVALAAVALLAAAAQAPAQELVRVRPVEFTAGITNECPIPDLVTGADGNVWFAEYANHAVGRITPAGKVNEFLVEPTDRWGFVGSVTPGPDGDIWFITLSGHVGHVSPQGTPTVFTAGITGFGAELDSWGDLGIVQPPAITRGPDGNLWFTELGPTIGRITPGGQVTEFTEGITNQPLLDLNGNPYGQFGGITAGPDGNVWFTELGGRIGRITPQGQVTEFQDGLTQYSGPTSIVTGPDGNLWFTELFGGKIGRITPQGQITEFPVTGGAAPQGIDVGPDGALWFAARGAAAVGRMSTTGQLTLYPHESDMGWRPTATTTGPDGRVWYSRSGGVGILAPATTSASGETAGPTVPRAVDRRPPRVTFLRRRGRTLTITVSERATLSVRSGRLSRSWPLRAGRRTVRLPAWAARTAARRGLRFTLRDAAGNRTSGTLR